MPPLFPNHRRDDALQSRAVIDFTTMWLFGLVSYHEISKIGLIALLIVGIYLIIMVTDTSDKNATSQSSSMNMAMPTKTVVPYPPGVPAISPTLPGKIPAYTTEDVRRYISSHALPAGLTVSGKQPAITKIEFISAHQANLLLQGKSIERPDTALVCYVELNGLFFKNSGSSSGATPPSATNSTAIEIFDAKTGNMLMYVVR